MQAAENLLQPPQRVLALFVADLGVGFRQRADHHRAFDGGGSFGQRLDEGMKGIVGHAAQLAGEGHHLVQQNQARCRLAKDRDQLFRAGVGAGAFRSGDGLNRLPAAQPPGQIAPQGAELAPILCVHRLGDTLVGAYEHRAPGAGQGFDAGSGEDRRHAFQLFRAIAGRRPGEVIERQHGVGFAAAEIGLKADHRLAAAPAQTLDHGLQHLPQPFGGVGDAEERRRIAVFLAALVAIDLRQIGGEFGIGEPRRQHVVMGVRRPRARGAGAPAAVALQG